MARNEPLAASVDDAGDRLLHLTPLPFEHHDVRTIVIRHGNAWPSLAVLLLCLLLMGAVLLGHHALRGVDAAQQQQSAAIARAERKLQQLEAGLSYDGARRHLLLGMRDQILKVNPRVSLSDAYLYARLALDESEKYPAVDPLLLLAIGTVESGYDPQARSHADARGLYQIWPSTGRLLARSLGWEYDEQTLFDPRKNTEAAALYLDTLFAAYNDPKMVLAEYNGGPVNAGYYRAAVPALSPETRNYVPRVLELYARLKEQFESGAVSQPQPARREPPREGKALGVRTPSSRMLAGASAGRPPAAMRSEAAPVTAAAGVAAGARAPSPAAAR
jgi:hypothetical protein